jgi:hypothetical protein
MLLAGFLAALSVSISFAADDDGLQWFGDYKQALREAKQSNKPLLVEFRCEA